MKKKELKLIAMSTVKGRGWTNGLIKKFYPICYKTVPNPKYKRASPMKLYCLARIKKIEKSVKFIKEMELTKKRKESSKKSIQTKIENLRKYLDLLQVDNIPVVKKNELIKLSCENYNNFRERLDPANSKSDWSFLQRICVNYLRHCMSEYEELLYEMSGKTGFQEGYDVVNKKIFEKISDAYPWLKEECEKQLVMKGI